MSMNDLLKGPHTLNIPPEDIKAEHLLNHRIKDETGQPVMAVVLCDPDTGKKWILAGNA